MKGKGIYLDENEIKHLLTQFFRTEFGDALPQHVPPPSWLRNSIKHVHVTWSSVHPDSHALVANGVFDFMAVLFV
jgi:hypothetical protein